MKVLTIIFSILTIIMLSALCISIIKNDDNSSSNKEKRYTLLYIFSFIILMLSSIFSTLEINTISIILLVVFIALLILATIIYLKNKKTINTKKKTLIPNKLKDNLNVLKEDRDGYSYKVKTKLVCCNTSDFKVIEIKDKDTNIVHCTCNKCNKEYEIYNSELDGYNLAKDNEVKIIKEDYKEHQCQCKKNSFDVEINYEYIDGMDEIKEIGITDLTNIYTSIIINLKCNNCNKKEKEYLKNEFK